MPPQPYRLSPIARSLFLGLLRHPPAFVVACRRVIIDSRCLQKLQSDVGLREAMKYFMQDDVTRDSPGRLHILTTPAVIIARIERKPERWGVREAL